MVYIASISVFSGVIIGLVGLLSLLEKKLVQGGDCKVLINDDEYKSPKVSSGTNLLTALSNLEIFVPSACGVADLVVCARCKFLKAAGMFFQQNTH